MNDPNYSAPPEFIPSSYPSGSERTAKRTKISETHESDPESLKDLMEKCKYYKSALKTCSHDDWPGTCNEVSAGSIKVLSVNTYC